MSSTFISTILFGCSISYAWRPDAADSLKVSLTPGAAGQLEIVEGLSGANGTLRPNSEEQIVDHLPHHTPNVSASFVEKDVKKGDEQKVKAADTTQQAAAIELHSKVASDASELDENSTDTDMWSLTSSADWDQLISEDEDAEADEDSDEEGGPRRGKRNRRGRRDDEDMIDDDDPDPDEDDLSWDEDDDDYNSSRGKKSRKRGGNDDEDSGGSNTMSVLCPDKKKWKPGRTLVVKTPNGNMITVKIPKGVKAGDKFQVAYDDDAPTAEIVQPSNTPPRAVDNTVWSKSSGQDLRGVLDCFGEAWAIRMDKNSMRRLPNTNWWFSWARKANNKKKGGAVGKKKDRFDYVKVEFTMDLRLLRHEGRTWDRRRKTPGAPVSIQRKAVYTKNEMETLINSRWRTGVKVTGWWQDQLQHFQGRAEEAYPKDRRWLAWAFIPWKKVDMRFDSTGANVLISWRPGGNNTWFKSTRNGHKNKRIEKEFRLEARPDVQDKELANIYVSGSLPMRGQWMQLTMRMYEWDKTGEDQCNGKMYMRLVDIIRKDQEKRFTKTEGAWGAKYNYSDQVSESAPGTQWFQFQGEEGTWSFDMRDNPQATGGKMYMLTSQGTSCLSGYGDKIAASKGGNPCPFLKTLYNQYEMKVLKKIVFLRPPQSELDDANGEFGRTIKHKHHTFRRWKNKKTDHAGEFRSVFPLYPIFDDHFLNEGGYSNVLQLNDRNSSASLDTLDVAWHQAESNDNDSVVEAVVDNDDGDNSSSNNRTNSSRSIKKKLSASNKQLRKLKSQNEELQNENAGLLQGYEKLGLQLRNAEAAERNYRMDASRLTAEERRMAGEIKEIENQEMIFYDPNRGAVMEHGRDFLHPHQQQMQMPPGQAPYGQTPYGQPPQQHPQFAYGATPQQQMQRLQQFNTSLQNDMMIANQHMAQYPGPNTGAPQYGNGAPQYGNSNGAPTGGHPNGYANPMMPVHQPPAHQFQQPQPMHAPMQPQPLPTYGGQQAPQHMAQYPPQHNAAPQYGNPYGNGAPQYDNGFGTGGHPNGYSNPMMPVHQPPAHQFQQPQPMHAPMQPQQLPMYGGQQAPQHMAQYPPQHNAAPQNGAPQYGHGAPQYGNPYGNGAPQYGNPYGR